MSPVDPVRNALAMVLAGGQGERLHPLTRDRAKPAVFFGGIYRIIDFTLSNCANSGLRRIYLLTQYRSLSLERHIRLGWSLFNAELDEFVYTVPPQQRMRTDFYQGTADAIYQNIYTLQMEKPEYVVILSGDHVYKMNYGRLLAFHVCDWRIPTEDLLYDRGLMGEGCIPIRQIRGWVEQNGFHGPVEVEIFSNRYWAMDQTEFLDKIKQAYLEHV